MLHMFNSLHKGFICSKVENVFTTTLLDLILTFCKLIISISQYIV